MPQMRNICTTTHIIVCIPLYNYFIIVCVTNVKILCIDKYNNS